MTTKSQKEANRRRSALYRKRNPGKCSALMAEYFSKIKVEVLSHYGGGRYVGGVNFYRAVLKSGDFSGLECRCFNCNCGQEWGSKD